MRFAKAAWDHDHRGFAVDPSAYLAELPGLRTALPPGAWEFASDPDHYDFNSARCVKDLVLSDISLPVEKNGNLALTFRPNKWAHETGLRIEYSEVAHFEITYGRSVDWMNFEAVLLDELLPHEAGCLHEIALTDAAAVVHCRDLRAVWGQGS